MLLVEENMFLNFVKIKSKFCLKKIQNYFKEILKHKFTTFFYFSLDKIGKIIILKVKKKRYI